MANSIKFGERVRIIRATSDHIQTIHDRARDADRAEVYAAARHTIAGALEFSMKASEFCLTATLDGQPEAMFGIGTVNALTGHACPWLLGTDAIDKNQKTFWQASCWWIAELRGRYSLLSNVVDDRHEKSKRWLTRLGFVLGEPINMGYEGRPFRPFEMRIN